MKANFLEKFESPQAPREEINVICFNDGLQEGRILTEVIKKKEFLPGAPCCGQRYCYGVKRQAVGNEAYLLHRVSCTVLGAMSSPSGGGGGVWTSGAGTERCGAGLHFYHRLLLLRCCYSCHHPQPPHSLPDLSPEKFYHLSGKERNTKALL